MGRALRVASQADLVTSSNSRSALEYILALRIQSIEDNNPKSFVLNSHNVLSALSFSSDSGLLSRIHYTVGNSKH